MEIEEIGTDKWCKDKQALYFVIHHQLPSLNDYIAKCRTNPHVGAKFKKDTETLLWQDIIVSRQAGLLRQLKPSEYPVKMEIFWREHTQKRDVDNIKSAAKYILDALVEYRVIENDSQKYISQIVDRVAVNKNLKTCVIVKIIPNRADGNGK